MFKISIIPDTNVLLSNIEIIKDLYSCEIPLLFTVNYAKMVLDELDNMKKKKVEARNAIRFIESVSNSLKTEIEGKIDERKIDVIIEGRDVIEPKNNDDKILNYCFQLENPIFLTNDKAFLLKCQSFNIKAISVEGLTIKDLVSSILNLLGINNNEISVLKEDYLQRLKNTLSDIIIPIIHQILYRELGDGYVLVLRDGGDIQYYLKLVQSNFFLFKNFLPSKSPQIIDKFLKSLDERNVEKLKQMVHPLCMLFRQSFPDDMH